MDISSILFLVYINFISLNLKKIREKGGCGGKSFTVSLPAKGATLFGDSGVGWDSRYIDNANGK